MNAHLSLLAARRALLVGEAAVQRQALAAELRNWEPSLQAGERLLGRLAWVHAHLYWVVAAGAAVASSARLRGWLQRGWTIWRVVRAVRSNRQP